MEINKRNRGGKLTIQISQMNSLTIVGPYGREVSKKKVMTENLANVFNVKSNPGTL